MKLLPLKLALLSTLMMFSVAMMAQSKSDVNLVIAQTGQLSEPHPEVKIVKIYPNPTTDFLVIEGATGSSCNTKQCLIAEIVDLNGTIHREFYLDLTNGAAEIDMRELEPQLYFFRVYNSDRTFSFEERIEKQGE